EEGPRRQQHAGRAEAALYRPRLREGCLQPIGRAVAVEAFHRDHRPPPQARGEHEAGARRLPVQEHGAGAAHALTAAVLGAVEGEPVAQEIEHGPVGRRVDPIGPLIEREVERAHPPSPVGLLSSAAVTLWANRPASSLALTFITASPIEPSRPSTVTSLA